MALRRHLIWSAVAAGYVLDRRFGEPPAAVHPVVWLGRASSAWEGRCYADRRGRGVAHVVVFAASAWGIGRLGERVVGRWAALAVAVWVASAERMLATEASTVAALLRNGDRSAARGRVRGLVGRDVESLDDAGLVRAAIESVAENSVDAVVATMVWGFVGGAPAVLAHRASNTLDAMIGHRSERYARYGWAAARADDVANFVPARVAAILVWSSRPRTDVWSTIRRDAHRHPSPNGGVVEAAYAAALGVTLGGSNSYEGVVSDRGRLGDGPPPVVGDIDRAVAVMRRASATGLAAMAIVSLVAAVRSPTAGPPRARRRPRCSGGTG